MPRRTPRPANNDVTVYITRNLPRALLTRLRARAAVSNTTLEDALNIALEAGLERLEGVAGRETKR